ncbi:MAG: alpha/beta hydrolase [Bacilli bacterium]|jgi:dienelactone hydrolase|nr:alpha/beta hydrolase [Bacilli bacterium]
MHKVKAFFNEILHFIIRAKKPLIVLGSFLLATLLCVGLGDGIQKDWGQIDVTSGMISAQTVDNEDYSMGYKLYVPKSATPATPAPAVLLLHGYQNDHETSAGFALEFARHGYVALAIDQFGHGATTTGIASRGWVNHKVANVNYGWDSREDKTYSFVSGPNRFKIMMNFSNTDFFIDKYSKSIDPITGDVLANENYIKDASMGGIAAYTWLATKGFVDQTKMAVTGHSMGTWASWSVSSAMCGAELDGVDITPRATILQAGEIFKTMRDANGRMAYDTDEDSVADIYWNNPLLLSAKYDEFNMFRDYELPPNGDLAIQGEPSINFLNPDVGEDPSWNKTFHEDFASGTSVRRNLYNTNHRLLTHNRQAIADSLEWTSLANGVALSLDKNNQTFIIKEFLVFIAMIMAIASAVTFIMLFKHIKWFAPVFAGIAYRPEKEKRGWKWWRPALITMAISALTYPFMTQLGHGLFPLPEKVFSMTIGNGFLVWYLILILIMLGTTLIPWFRKKKKRTLNTDFVDMGLARDDEEHKYKFDWALLAKSAIVVFAGVLWMYLQVVLSQSIFQLDFRFIWPFFKMFNLSRFLQFLVYIPFFALFFILNNSKIFASNRIPGTNENGVRAFVKVWWKYALCMVGGILFIILLEYIPFFANIGPGADLLFSSTFGGPFMSLLIVFAPQIVVFSLICTYFYKKTGNVFVGALLVAILACWIVTGGSAMMYTF